MSKVWLITGAGRGMGVDIAKAALAAGHAVVATGRRPEAVAHAVGAAEHLLTVKLDVTVPEDAEAAVKAAVEQFGKIDVLINNAASFQAGFFEEVEPSSSAQMDVNFFGVLNVTRAVLPDAPAAQRAHRHDHLDCRGRRRAVHLRICGLQVSLEGWMEALHPEVAPYGIKTTWSSLGFSAPSCSKRNRQFCRRCQLTTTQTRTRQILPVWETGNRQADWGSGELAHAPIVLLDSPEPPERWVAGADAVQAVIQKAELLRQQASAFLGLSAALLTTISRAAQVVSALDGRRPLGWYGQRRAAGFSSPGFGFVGQVMIFGFLLWNAMLAVVLSGGEQVTRRVGDVPALSSRCAGVRRVGRRREVGLGYARPHAGDEPRAHPVDHARAPKRPCQSGAWLTRGRPLWPVASRRCAMSRVLAAGRIVACILAKVRRVAVAHL